MKTEKKEYILNDKLKIKTLKKNDFKEGGFMKNVPAPKYFYNKNLIDDIQLHIEISINPDGTFSFDDFDNIIVLDDNFCQPYYPFYTSDNDFPYLNKVIKKYNKAMDELIENGILKEKTIKKDDNVKIKKYRVK